VTNNSTGNPLSTLTLAGSGGYTYGGVIQNGATANVALTVNLTGSGAQTLTGVNTYTGATIINSGKLIVGDVQGVGSIDSAVTVNSGGTLGGRGTVGTVGNVANAVTVNTGGTLAPGTSTPGSSGLLRVNGNLILASGSIFEWSLSEVAPTPVNRGTAYDAVNVTGNLQVTDAIFKIVIPTLDMNTAFWGTSKGWSVFDKALAASTGFGSFSVFSSSNLTTPISYSGGTFSFNNNTGELYWVAAPEPSGALAVVLMVGGLVRRRRVA
jgi:autotransporter-associated beta strand protein